MPKFRASERELIKTLVASLSLKRIPDLEILGEIEKQMHKPISQRYLTEIKQQIKRENFHWYQTLRESQYHFLHEYKERINEIVDLQRRHYKIIEDNPSSPTIQQTSLAELHRLNITLSNYFDVAPMIVSNPVKHNQNDSSISIPQENIIV